MLDVTVAAAPHRDRESLRRGVFHNSKRLADRTWTWRYDSFRNADGFAGLWDDVPALHHAHHAGARRELPHFVNDEDAEAFSRNAHRPSGAPYTSSPISGHSVQGDQPLRTDRDPARRAYA